jgi:hypothetical protein
VSYLEQPRIFGTIVGSFFVVFLPLAYLTLVPNDFHWLPHVLLLQAVVLGVSHFFITLALYGNRDNLRYFGRSVGSALLYFGVPFCCFALFAAIAAHGIAQRPFFALYFFPTIRILDFLHVGRQSFGVAQLLKRSVAGLPRRLRTLENVMFVGLAFLEWQTALTGGRFDARAATAVLPVGAVGCMLVVIVSEYLKHGDKAGNVGSIGRPLAYVLLQAVCAGAAIYRTRLYLVALTMHYVEYHLLMSPRIFSARTGERASAGEHGAAGPSASGMRVIRVRVVAFYVALLALVIAFEARNHVSVPVSLAPVVHLFDGIFVVHYFVEAFVWKFTNPYFREQLLPLYVGGAERRGLGARPFSARLPAWPEALAITVVVAIAGTLLFREDRLSAAFDRAVAQRMRAQLELEWGADFAQSGEIRRATDHFERAVAFDPDNRDAERALSQARFWRSRMLTTEAAP